MSYYSMLKTANLKNIEDSSFDSIKYFVEKYYFLFTVKDGENNDIPQDLLQKQLTESCSVV